MKILYTNFHQGDGGGHTTYVMSLARRLSERASVVVAAPADSRLLDEAARLPGVRRVALPFKGPPTQQWLALRQLRALLREKAFDVIHVNDSADHRMSMLAVAGMGARRPFIVYTHPAQRPAVAQSGDAPAGVAGDRPRDLRQR
ncbi:glycosyltransferase family 4 protein [Achromobacter xylosoxidans]|uniref:glycosyltransferase family 4 protein n=1 Tax=Alcaligenes xylosoxydans xylosoxydans TaxID=85698 RepID=UPI003F612659